jgi:hypothetical protein
LPAHQERHENAAVAGILRGYSRSPCRHVFGKLPWAGGQCPAHRLSQTICTYVIFEFLPSVSRAQLVGQFEVAESTNGIERRECDQQFGFG